VFGGFQYEMLDQRGGDISRLGDNLRGFISKANQSGRVVGLFSSFRADDPQLVVDIDRDRARSLDLPLQEVTDALQVFLGSAYVNDFDFNNRSYRVYVQADQSFRMKPEDISRYYARTDAGRMMPLTDVISIDETSTAKTITHFNLFRSAEINGSAAPGFSSGQALQTMQDLSNQVLPQGFTYAWSGQSLEETKAGNQSTLIFALGLLLVYLTLAAQYESITLPFIILLSVPLAVMGALLAQWGRGLINDVYCQIGLVMLIGLSAKNGILIVEFAEQLRARGMSIAEAAVEAARIRLRPILMTSLAFILGVMPLVVATGAGRASRHSVGTAVVGGMIAATFLNLAFIPVLYVVVKRLTDRRGDAAQ
jgi:HAE1 family hydrophobic/amphiphilic exporter-1